MKLLVGRPAEVVAQLDHLQIGGYVDQPGDLLDIGLGVHDRVGMGHIQGEKKARHPVQKKTHLVSRLRILGIHEDYKQIKQAPGLRRRGVGREVSSGAELIPFWMAALRELRSRHPGRGGGRRLATELGVSNVSLTNWLKGVRVTDLSYNDNAGLLSVKVKQIATKPHYASIVAGNLSFGRTTIDQPRVEISLKDKPPPTASPPPQAQAAPAEAAGIALVTDVVVKDGNVKVTDTKARTTEL